MGIPSEHHKEGPGALPYRRTLLPSRSLRAEEQGVPAFVQGQPEASEGAAHQAGQFPAQHVWNAPQHPASPQARTAPRSTSQAHLPVGALGQDEACSLSFLAFPGQAV
jgi:hypothetical protein